MIAEIQRVDGFEDFLATPDFGDVARAAGVQPLVYLAAAEPGGLALVVRGSAVTDVELPALTADAVRSRTEGYLRDYERFRRDTDSEELRAAWRSSLDEVARWLWDAAVAPVLDELGDPPETAVVPCGLLGLLPLHAAWTEDATTPTGRRYAVDRTAFAYGANARALAACRRRAEALSAERVLAVYDSARLAYTEPEAVIAANAFAASELLTGDPATVDAVEQGLRLSDVFHAGCHGRADFADPLRSYLLLPGDRRLELERILRMRLRLRLAVLSACESSLPGTELPDEVVGLPSGLVQAGVAGVVATMWVTGQHASALLITRFYRDWQGGSPALALAGAQRWLRDVTVAQLEQEWETALDDGAAWLPPEAGEKLLTALLDRDLAPGDRPWSGIDVWAAAAFTGA
ncbi:CHAT domain-containing protein [Amycolatopsis sp. DG1A-15b]|uniref:CHAT domain-containing protein n=1 Tax=Amycolatopsis sp. DG1A-15b TaxID=3052846 RepID=UPI00255BDD09|nr:CHAT domain-containing protein [Amycolatopsis sp. DG1A-15b]WIX92526.1 CHAT domain-containing protein [Amycolatopsis sp. DG1A-15b]